MTIKDIKNIEVSKIVSERFIGFPASVKKIPNEFCAGLECLKTTFIASESVGDFAFYKCKNLNHVLFNKNKKTMHRIGICAFTGTNINVIDLDDKKIKSIGAAAFKDCGDINYIGFKNVKTHIDKDAFAHNKINELILPFGSINSYAFRGSCINHVVIPYVNSPDYSRYFSNVMKSISGSINQDTKIEFYQFRDLS